MLRTNKRESLLSFFSVALGGMGVFVFGRGAHSIIYACWLLGSSFIVQRVAQ